MLDNLNLLFRHKHRKFSGLLTIKLHILTGCDEVTVYLALLDELIGPLTTTPELVFDVCLERLVCPAATSEVWWQRLRWEASVWYSEPRIAMMSSNTGKPAHNPMTDFCVMYMGHKHEKFLEVFQETIKSGGRVYCGIVAAPVAV